MKHILFLDFDGVLVFSINSAGTKHPSVSLLEKFLFDNPHVFVVFSTDWRNSQTLDELKMHFSYKLQDRFIGVTPNSANTLFKREHEILNYMKYNAPEAAFVALDDRRDLFSPQCNFLVLVKHVQCNHLLQEDLQKVTLMFEQQKNKINHSY